MATLSGPASPRANLRPELHGFILVRLADNTFVRLAGFDEVPVKAPPQPKTPSAGLASPQADGYDTDVEPPTKAKSSAGTPSAGLASPQAEADSPPPQHYEGS